VAVGEGGEEVRGTREDFVGWAKRSVPTLFETSGCSTLHHASSAPKAVFSFSPSSSRSGRATFWSKKVARLRRIYQAVQRRHPFETVAICILPDHIHALWALPDGDADFSTRWSLIKSGFSRGLDARARSTSKVAKREKGIWQRRYWEHAIRDDEDFERHVDYIHFNPVKHGHVNRIADWPHSSFHRYVERGLLAPDWAGDLRNIQGSFGE
jgi:putative transposase